MTRLNIQLQLRHNLKRHRDVSAMPSFVKTENETLLNFSQPSENNNNNLSRELQPSFRNRHVPLN